MAMSATTTTTTTTTSGTAMNGKIDREEHVPGGGGEVEEDEDGDVEVAKGEDRHRLSQVEAKDETTTTTPTKNTNRRSSNHFFLSAVSLSACNLGNYYLIANIFPYSGFMTMHLIDGLTPQTSAPYAGMLVSSFMIGRVISSYPWGIIADTYGRRVVLITGLISTTCLSLIFGYSTSFAMAFATRFTAGLTSGLMVVLKTSITELAKGDHDLERKGVGILTTVGGFGLLISPALGGILSNPLKQYPNEKWFNGALDNVLAKYPFLLPNFAGSLICFVSLFFVLFTVEETLPDDKRRDVRYIISDLFYLIRHYCLCIWHYLTCVGGCKNIDDTTTEASSDYDNESQPLLETGSPHEPYTTELDGGDGHSSSTSGVAIMAKTSADVNAIQQKSTKDVTVQSLLSERETRMYFATFGMNVFLYFSLNEAFPLWAMNKNGGFGWDEKEIGAMASFSGLLYSLTQYFVYTYMMKTFGLVRTLQLSSRHLLICIFYPIAMLLHSWMRPAFIVLIMTSMTMANSILYSCATIGTNRTVDSSQRASLNGLSVIVGSASRACGPLFAGWVVSISMSSLFFPAEYGSLMIYGIYTIVGVAAYASTFLLNDD